MIIIIILQEKKEKKKKNNNNKKLSKSKKLFQKKIINIKLNGKIIRAKITLGNPWLILKRALLNWPDNSRAKINESSSINNNSKQKKKYSKKKL